MPILPVYRDPMLISIDRQRLNDFGIPAEPGHENLFAMWGAFGVITPVLIVPQGWQDALPDTPPEEEWDLTAWEAASHDSSNERPQHSSHLSSGTTIGVAVLLGALAWLISSGPTLIFYFHELSKAPQSSHENDSVLMENLIMFPLIIALTAAAGACAPALGKLFRNQPSMWLIAGLAFFFIYILPVILPLLAFWWRALYGVAD